MYVSSDIPAGNGLVTHVEESTVTLRPDLRGQSEHWFYYCVALRDIRSSTVTVQFADGRPYVGPAGPAVSFDGGSTWRWHTAAAGRDMFVLPIPEGCREVHVSTTYPYQADALESALTGLPGLRRRTLCTSHGGRDVPLIELGAAREFAAYRVVLSARHHACESMASFVLDGVVRALATIDDLRAVTDRGQWLALPFMDADGVASGDHGKFRAPHDHNRDYGHWRYAETAALQDLVTSGPPIPTLSLDLHCPYIRGGRFNESVYFPLSDRPEMAAEQRRFSAILKEAADNVLDHKPDDNLPWGEGWNTTDPHDSRSCSRWFAQQPGCRFAATLEIPYGSANGRPVTPKSCRRFGAAIARAFNHYLDESDSDIGADKHANRRG